MNRIYLSKGLKATMLSLAVLLGSPVLLTSCEDTLEKPSFTADDVDYVFSDLDKSDLFVKGCYRNLAPQEHFRTSNTGETVTMAAEDDMNGSKWAVGNYHFDPIKPYVFGDSYRLSYDIIESCNLGLKRIGQMEESERRNAQMAELYFIRAYAYHNLIRFLGDVPAFWTPMEDRSMSDPDVLYPTRQDRDGIYDQIISDMVAHVEELPWQSANPYGTNERITRNAGYGILARIALHAGGYSLRWNLETNDPSTLQFKRRDDAQKVREFYEIADKALETVINQGENWLIQNQADMSGFQYLFHSFTGGNYAAVAPEMMWMIAQQGDKTNSVFGVYNGTTGAQSDFYGNRKCLQSKLPSYYLSFDAADTRRDVTCANYTISRGANETEYNVGTTFSSVMGGKFRIQWGVEPFAAAKRNIDVPMLRYSDILLMYAETQNYLNGGPTAKAISALKQVRERAGIGSMDVPQGEQAFLEALMQERKWELADEFVLRTDLVRTGLLDSQLKASKQDMLDLSDRTGKYANIAVYRVYKADAVALKDQAYGVTTLTVPYFELTDPAEIAQIETMPRATQAAKVKQMQATMKAIVEAHGYKYNNDWYPCNMFEAISSTYNSRARQVCGGVGSSAFGIGSSISTKSTGRAENGGEYPDWIEGPQGLYYGYKANQTELSPFACKQAGHPLVDNPRLTQLPGYQGTQTEL